MHRVLNRARGKDPEGFLAALRTAVPATDGLAVYGAACCAVEHLGHGIRNPDFLALLDAGIAHKRSLGMPSSRLKGYEWSRWLEVNGPNTW